MEKKAMITIRGTQKSEFEKPQVMEFITGGKLQRFGRKLCVSYEESDLIGMEGVTTTFVVDGGKVSMERSGKLRARMRFVEGQRTESLYSLDVGTMLLGITARRLESDLTEEGGEFIWNTGLNWNGISLGSTPMIFR